MFGISRRTKIRTPYGYGARAPLPPIPQGRSWGKETPLTDEIRITPPPPMPPQRYCDCLLRYETHTNTWGERVCEQCRKPRPKIEVFMTPATHEAKERMNMPTTCQCKEKFKIGKVYGGVSYCDTCHLPITIINTSVPAEPDNDAELTRLQSLLSTPNLSQANIDEINAQISTLLAKKRGAEKTGEVWLDGK